MTRSYPISCATIKLRWRKWFFTSCFTTLCTSRVPVTLTKAWRILSAGAPPSIFFATASAAGSAEHERAIRAWEEELEFSEFIEKLGAALNELYARAIPEEEKLLLREQVFTRGKEEWSEWVTKHPTHRFRNFSKQPLNNAVMIHYMLYLKDLKLFEALYETEGKSLVQAIDVIRAAVAKGGEPFEAVQDVLNNRASQASS